MERVKHAKIKPKAAFQYEDMVDEKMNRSSSPPPVPPPPIPPPPNPETLQRLSQSYPHDEYVTIQLIEPQVLHHQDEILTSPPHPSYPQEQKEVQYTPNVIPKKPEIIILVEPDLPANPNIITESVNPSIETFKPKRSVSPTVIYRSVQEPKSNEIRSEESKTTFDEIPPPSNHIQSRSSQKSTTEIDSAPAASKPAVGKPAGKPKTAVEEVREAVKDVTEVLIRSLKDETNLEEKIPDGVVKNAKSSLAKDREKVGLVKRSNEIEEELREIAGEGKVKKTASAYNVEAKAKTGQSESAKPVPPSRKIAQLFKAEFR